MAAAQPAEFVHSRNFFPTNVAHVRRIGRVRYHLQSGPMRVAQQFLNAVARDWDDPLEALRSHLE
jgi:hypothetical protein